MFKVLFSFVLLSSLLLIPNSRAQEDGSGSTLLKKADFEPGSSKPTKAYSVEFSETTREKPQELVVSGLVPGKVNQVNFRVKNATGDLLHLGKITVSCGCMVVKDFKSAMAVGAESELELHIKVGSGVANERREIRFDASDGNSWKLLLDCQPVRIFNVRPFVFDVGFEDTNESREIRMDFEKSAILSGLVAAGAEKFTCSSNGAFIREAKISQVEDGVEIVVTPDWDRFGLKKSMFEILEIQAPDFRTSISVEFRNKSVVRVSPTVCSVLKLLSGGQRFCLVKDEGIGELGLRGISNKGEKFPIEIVDSIALNSGAIVELACENAQIRCCEKIEVFELSKPDVVLSKIVVENPNSLELTKNVR